MPEVPLFKRMPTAPEALLEPPAASGLRPCAQTHLKKILYHALPVTYWPSPGLSIKRCTCVNKRKNSETGVSGRRYRNITLTCGRSWIRWSWQMRTPTGSRWMSNKDITWCHRRLGSVLVPVGDRMILRTSSRQRAWALNDPRLSSPARMRKKCCYG